MYLISDDGFFKLQFLNAVCFKMIRFDGLGLCFLELKIVLFSGTKPTSQINFPLFYSKSSVPLNQPLFLKRNQKFLFR